MIAFFRLWLLGLILGFGWSVLSFVLTKNRRYLQMGWKIVVGALLFAASLIALRFLQRAVLF